MNYPRLLVLSNNSFSKQNSNGRTLGSLLRDWPKDKIAQFCISSDGADFDVCKNYYCVTDGDVLRSTLCFHVSKRRDLKNQQKIDSNSRNGHVVHRKTTLKMFARNIAWNLGLWKGCEFDKWLESVNPQIVLLQSGESYFMMDLTLKIARKYNAKIAIFNTEGFYFFKKDFFPKDGAIGHQLFKLYQMVYRRHFRKFMSSCSKQIYGNDLLMKDYDTEFGSENSCVVYTGSSLSPKFKSEISKPPKFSYLGNLGFNRPEALAEFAEVILSINPQYCLDVYGFAKNTAMEEKLRNTPGIIFHGAVPYTEVVEVMENSDFLIHVESQCEQWRESLRYGFSTKIADSISSGKIFVLYAAENIACAQYIKNNKAGIFASTKDSLRRQITDILENPVMRHEIFNIAASISHRNHNPFRNTEKVFKYLIQ